MAEIQDFELSGKERGGNFRCHNQAWKGNARIRREADLILVSCTKGRRKLVRTVRAQNDRLSAWIVWGFEENGAALMRTVLSRKTAFLA